MAGYLELIISITFIWLAATLSPGPDFAVTSRYALSRSRYAASGAALGITFGSALLAVMSLFGLSAVPHITHALTPVIRILGGGYLLYLGMHAALHAAKPADLPPRTHRPEGKAKDIFAGFKRGLLTCLLNPKGMLFFLSLYAFGITPETPPEVKSVIIAAGLTGEYVWYMSIGVLFSRRAVRRGYARLKTPVDYIFALFFISAGCKILTMSNG